MGPIFHGFQMGAHKGRDVFDIQTFRCCFRCWNPSQWIPGEVLLRSGNVEGKILRLHTGALGPQGGPRAPEAFFCIFCILEGWEAFQRVPRGRGYVLTKYQLKWSQPDLIHCQNYIFSCFWTSQISAPLRFETSRLLISETYTLLRSEICRLLNSDTYELLRSEASRLLLSEAYTVKQELRRQASD